MSEAEEGIEELMTGEAPPVVGSTNTSLLLEPAQIPITLPSKGILYKGDPNVGDIDSDGQIFIKPITLDDLELFMTPELIESGTVIDALFRRCIKSNINPKYLLVSDRNYILMYLRAQSYGSKYSFTINCGNTACGTPLKKTIDIGTLPVIFLDEVHGKYNEKGELIKGSLKDIKEPFECELTMTNTVVKFKLPRGIDESERTADRYRNKLKKELQEKTVKRSGVQNDGSRKIMSNIDPYEDEDVTVKVDDPSSEREALKTVLSRSIVSIARKDGSEVYTEHDQIERVLQNLPGGDISELQQHMTNADAGIDMNVEIKCPLCRHVNKTMMPLSESFFRREV